VIGFGSEVAIGAKGEAFSGCEQKLLPHLCDCAYAEREGLGFCRLNHSNFKTRRDEHRLSVSLFPNSIGVVFNGR